MPERFVIRQVTGGLRPNSGGGNYAPGITVSVHDRAFCYRTMSAYASEDRASAYGVTPYGGGVYLGRVHARRLADELCDRLNAECDPLEY